jgi:hypothetical protein
LKSNKETEWWINGNLKLLGKRKYSWPTLLRAADQLTQSRSQLVSDPYIWLILSARPIVQALAPA